jgi:antitoxin CptB
MPNNILAKQIIYRSTHRGCKETDFLIGEFAKANLSKIDDLELFGKFLEEDDLKIYDWILGKDIAPNDYAEILKEIKAFHRL